MLTEIMSDSFLFNNLGCKMQALQSYSDSSTSDDEKKVHGTTRLLYYY